MTSESAKAGMSPRDVRACVLLGLGLFAAWAVVLGGRPWVQGIPDLIPPDAPWRAGPVLDHAGRLYLVFPLWLLAALVVLLAPGLLAAFHLGPSRSACDAAVRAFALAFALRLPIHAAGVLAGIEWSTTAFIIADAALVLGLWGALLVRAARGRPTFTPDPADLRRIGWMLAMPLLLGVFLLPWIFWQDLNGDAIEVLEIGRSLSSHVIPRAWNHQAFQSLGVGMLTAAYPVHWFVALLGPLDASARLPVLLFAPLILAAVIELAETGSPRRLAAAEELAVLASLVSFLLALGLNGSEEPYSTDLAMPGTTDSILVLCVTAALLFLARRRTAWFLGFALLAGFDRPTGLLFLLFLAVALVVFRHPDRRGWAWRVALAIALFVGAAWLLESVYIPTVTGARGNSASVIQRLQYLRFTDVQRFLFLIVPTGIVPAAALLAVRRQDPLARTVAVVCVAYFAFFYVEAFIALHHFVLAMFLPVVVYWRVALRSGDGRRFALLATAGAGLGIALALPPDFSLYRTPRAIGARTVYDVGGYLGKEREFRESLRGIPALHLLFEASRIQSPGEGLVINALVVAHYATRIDPPLDSANYLIRAEGDIPPAGFTRVGTADGVSAFVRDTTLWARDRRITPPTDFESRVYAIPQRTQKRYIGVPAGNYDLNLGELPILWRLFAPRETVSAAGGICVPAPGAGGAGTPEPADPRQDGLSCPLRI